MSKYIFVTGGVVSSIGKGIVAASIGKLLKEHGLKVTIQKFDPYINVDPGTMSPYQHGEVFVTDDGAETDLDLGHYERLVDVRLNQYSNVTTGKIYAEVIQKERKGDYLGRTVQVIPHITDAIKEKIMRAGETTQADIVITEVGGTVGDIESLPYLEALRQVKKDVGAENVLYLHVTLLPYLRAAGELKTKPTQHSVKELRAIGIQPNILVLRTEQPVPDAMKQKLALFCDVEPEAIIENGDVDSIYEVPLQLKAQRLDEIILEQLQINSAPASTSNWDYFVQKIKQLTHKVRIAIVGKYVALPDAYLSVVEALKHAGYQEDAAVEIEWVDAEELTRETVANRLENVAGILVPGGFGIRGIEGKLIAIQYAREKQVPFLGICLGMQVATMEFARNVAGLREANSTEFNPATPHPVISLLPDQAGVDEMGGTLRLGLYPCNLQPGTLAASLYQQETIQERHRHRYEFNNEYREKLAEHGLLFSGLSPDNRLVEVVELANHPYFIACQYHPEFLSRPQQPHPLFVGLLQAVKKKKNFSSKSTESLLE